MTVQEAMSLWKSMSQEERDEAIDRVLKEDGRAQAAKRRFLHKAELEKQAEEKQKAEKGYGSWN